MGKKYKEKGKGKRETKRQRKEKQIKIQKGKKEGFIREGKHRKKRKEKCIKK